MARFTYPDFEDKAFRAVGKPTINVLKLLSYSPATIEQWCSIGNAQFSKLELPKKFRELVILLSTAKFGSAYEFNHHIPLSSKFGITDEMRAELIKAGKTKSYFPEEYWQINPAGFESKEQDLLVFLEAVIDSGEISEELWHRIIASFSQREVVEIVSMQGFYYTFSRLTTVLKVDFDGTDAPPPKL